MKNDKKRKHAEQNITGRKRAEEWLALLAHTIRSIGECVSVTDTENRILFVNDAFSRTYGYAPDELIGQSISIVRSPRTQPPTDEVLYSTRQGGWQGEMVNRKKDGTEFPIALSTSIVRNEEGHVLALVGIALDITERKQAEALLRSSEAQFRALFENALIGIGVADMQGNLLAVNDILLKSGGYDREDIIRISNVGMLYHDPKQREEVLAIFQAEGFVKGREVKFRRKDGTSYDCRLSLVGTTFNGRTFDTSDS